MACDTEAVMGSDTSHDLPLATQQAEASKIGRNFLNASDFGMVFLKECIHTFIKGLSRERLGITAKVDRRVFFSS
jgi:hypothetical protein